MSSGETRGRHVIRPGSVWYLAALAVAALAVVLLLAPRVAVAASNQLVETYENTVTGSSNVTVTVGDALDEGDVMIAHVAATRGGGGGSNAVRCIDTTTSGWTYVDPMNAHGSTNHVAAVFVLPVTSDIAAGSTHTFRMRQSADCADSIGSGTRGITAVITRWQGIDVSDPVFDADQNGGSGGSNPRLAPSIADAPEDAVVLRLFSFEEYDNTGRVSIGGNCSNQASFNAGRIYGGPEQGNSNGEMPGGGSGNSAHALGAFANLQGGAGATGTFAGQYCSSLTDPEVMRYTAFTVVLNPIPPAVTKTGTTTPANTPYTWNITIDNTHDFATGGWDVVITDPNVTMAANADCTQAGDVITCPDVDAGAEIVLTVTRNEPITSCAPLTDTNTITALTITSGGLVHSDVGAWLVNVPTTISGNLLLCPPLHPATPSPTPSPTATATATPSPTPVTGCTNPVVPAGTFSVAIAPQGSTIAIWGGGNVSEFPTATSFWTTVNGQWVGYIQGAPSWVNANFMAAFPNGDVPACTGFIVFRL